MYIDIDKIKDKAVEAKNYVIDNAPALVTAAATVALTVLVHKSLQFSKGAYGEQMRLRYDMAMTIDHLRRGGYEFDYYPGIGVWSDFKGVKSGDESSTN